MYPRLRMWHQMCLILWILVRFIRTAFDALCEKGTAQAMRHTLSDHSSSSKISSNLSASCLFKQPKESMERDNLAKTDRFGIIELPPQNKRQEEGSISACTTSPASESCSYASLDQQESGRCMQQSATDSSLPNNVITSEEFRAQMAKDVLSIKNTLPPSPATLNETFALMNRRVILPSAEIVHWFSNKGAAGTEPCKALPLLHHKCALAYRKIPEPIRRQKETTLLKRFAPVINTRSHRLTSKDRRTLTSHRGHINLLATHIVDSFPGITTAHACKHSQSDAQPPIFGYSAFDVHTQSRLCLCLAVQLLTSGFACYIPASFFPLLQEIPAANGATLVCYVLDPDYVEVFPEFITAFYIIWSGMCTDAESPTLLACHSNIIGSITTSMRLLYGKELAAQEAHLRQLVSDCYPALHALGAGELTDGDSACVAAVEKASVYWHVLAALAMSAALAYTKDSIAVVRPRMADAAPSVAEHTARTSYLVQHLRMPVAGTASLRCWAAVITALTHVLPLVDGYAFMVAHTPPAFAGPLLRCGVIHSTVYVIIVALWLIFETPHADSILANLEGMYKSPVYLYKIQLLTHLPVSLFRRAPPKLLHKICLALFELDHVRSLKRQERAASKQQANNSSSETEYANKRRRGISQGRTGAIVTEEGVQSPSIDDVMCETQVTAASGGVRNKRKRTAEKRCVPHLSSPLGENEEPLTMEYRGNNSVIAPSTLYISLYVHCLMPDDISDEEFAHFVSNKRDFYYLMSLFCGMARGKPRMQSLNRISSLKPPMSDIYRELLEIFGDPPEPSSSKSASAAGLLSCDDENSHGSAARTELFEATENEFNELEQPNMEDRASISGASQARAIGVHDLSWDMHANSGHFIRTLPAFFPRQFLPHLIDVICTNPCLNNSGDLLKAVEYILNMDGLARNMQLLEKVLRNAAAVYQEARHEQPELAQVILQQANEAPPGMPRFVLKSDPAMCISLEDVELLIQPSVASAFLDARAYMEIADALHRLIFRILGALNSSQEKFASSSDICRFLIRIINLLPRESPFIYLAPGPDAQAQIKCTWSPIFRASPSRASPTAIPDKYIVKAIKSACYWCLHALSTKAQVEQCLALFTWLFTRSAVQSVIASPAVFLSKLDNKAERALAKAISDRLAGIHSLITDIIEDGANRALCESDDDNQPSNCEQADGSCDDRYHSLRTMLIHLLSLFNVPKRVIKHNLAIIHKKSKPHSAANYRHSRGQEKQAACRSNALDAVAS